MLYTVTRAHMRVTFSSQRMLTCELTFINTTLSAQCLEVSHGNTSCSVGELYWTLSKMFYGSETLVVNYSVRNRFVRSFVRSSIRSFIRLFIRSFVRSFVRSCVRAHSALGPFLRSGVLNRWAAKSALLPCREQTSK